MKHTLIEIQPQELQFILSLLKHKELWPMLAMFAVFVIFAWMDEMETNGYSNV